MKNKIRLFVSFVFSVCLFFGFNSNSIANVGPDGSFNYSIPIELPQGTAGCAPSLALVYNSNAGNGMLGMGWDIAGLGAITRDTSYPVDYNPANANGPDHFVGPGGRLVDTGTTDPAGNEVYHYENESFCRVSYVGTQGDGPSYWIETKPDGTKYYYGYTLADGNDIELYSKVWAEGKTYSGEDCVRAWALSKVEDLHGNYYSVEYLDSTQNTGEYYPYKITYTENLGFPLSDKRTVEFDYEDRSDFYATYTFGCSVQIKKRLEYIYVKLDGSTVRTYELDYDNLGTTGGSRLVSVADSWSENGMWEFGLKSNNTDFYLAATSSTPFADPNWNSGLRSFQMDVNGDGKGDLVMRYSSGEMATYLSNG
ncbi:MAG: hypothetical protein JXN64_12330, partial [Spirochaetes bacterium]|nr:hypothetical protein [Spirochaetota bacterium]